MSNYRLKIKWKHIINQKIGLKSLSGANEGELTFVLAPNGDECFSDGNILVAISIKNTVCCVIVMYILYRFSLGYLTFVGF